MLNTCGMQVMKLTQFGTEVLAGKGRSDIVMINDANRIAVIIEVKYNKSAKEALD